MKFYKRFRIRNGYAIKVGFLSFLFGLMFRFWVKFSRFVKSEEGTNLVCWKLFLFLYLEDFCVGNNEVKFRERDLVVMRFYIVIKV